MAIKLDDLASWKLVPQGEVLTLAGELDDPRRIRIDLNCEDRTWVYVSAAQIKVDAQFVAAVGPGLDTIEFYAGGELAVRFAPASPDDKPSQVWVYTAEIEPNVAPAPDAVSFTEIHQRRARNPELEMMQLIARTNERRMDEKMAQLEALIAEKERVANVDPGPVDGAAGATGKQPQGGAAAPSGENAPDGSEPEGSADDGSAPG